MIKDRTVAWWWGTGCTVLSVVLYVWGGQW